MTNKLGKASFVESSYHSGAIKNQPKQQLPLVTSGLSGTVIKLFSGEQIANCSHKDRKIEGFSARLANKTVSKTRISADPAIPQ